MSDNVITLSERAGLFPKRKATPISEDAEPITITNRQRRRNRPSTRTQLFRSYDVILEADEADLVRSVGLDIHKAEAKLKKTNDRLKSVQENSASEIEELIAVKNKLSAAIVEALLLTRREG